MKTRAIILSAVCALASCTPAEPQPPSALPPASPAVSPPQPQPEPSFVYYRVLQAGHLQTVLDEVRLDATASRCFQATRRRFGGFSFDEGKDAIDRAAFSQEVGEVLDSWKELTKQGSQPSLVLHGYAERDEADTADAAQALSVRRAESVKAMLVQAGLPANRLHVDGHGWELSPAPLRGAKELGPNRRVEISADRTPPSSAKRIDAAPIDAALLERLQSKVRDLDSAPSPAADSRYAPRVALVIHDAKGDLEVSFDVASASPQAAALQHYFMRGLSNGCTFEPLD